MLLIDRLVWAAGVTFTAYGVPMGVRVTQPGIIDRVLRLVPLGWRARRDPRVPHLFSMIVGGERGWRGRRDYHLLYEGAARIARTFDLDEAFDELEKALLHRLAQAAPRHVILNAGAVEWRGRAIVIAADKPDDGTALTRALVQAGGRLYADGVLVLDREGRVHPYPRPVPAPRHPHLTPGHLGPAVPVGTVVVASPRRGAPMSSGQGLLALLRLAQSVRQHPRQVLETLRVATRPARFLQATRGESAALARALLRE